MNTSGKSPLQGEITPAQVRAARGLLGWAQDDLAATSGVPRRTLVRLERAEGVSRPETLAAVRPALGAGGVAFIAANGDGPVVRLRKCEAP